jgi:hypothetical protein
MRHPLIQDRTGPSIRAGQSRALSGHSMAVRTIGAALGGGGAGVAWHLPASLAAATWGLLLLTAAMTVVYLGALAWSVFPAARARALRVLTADAADHRCITPPAGGSEMQQPVTPAGGPQEFEMIRT